MGFFVSAILTFRTFGEPNYRPNRECYPQIAELSSVVFYPTGTFIQWVVATPTSPTRVRPVSRGHIWRARQAGPGRITLCGGPNPRRARHPGSMSGVQTRSAAPHSGPWPLALAGVLCFPVRSLRTESEINSDAVLRHATCTPEVHLSRTLMPICHPPELPKSPITIPVRQVYNRLFIGCAI